MWLCIYFLSITEHVQIVREEEEKVSDSLFLMSTVLPVIITVLTVWTTVKGQGILI